jgi:hypothetical protein
VSETRLLTERKADSSPEKNLVPDERARLGVKIDGVEQSSSDGGDKRAEDWRKDIGA